MRKVTMQSRIEKIHEKGNNADRIEKIHEKGNNAEQNRENT